MRILKKYIKCMITKHCLTIHGACQNSLQWTQYMPKKIYTYNIVNRMCFALMSHNTAFWVQNKLGYAGDRVKQENLNEQRNKICSCR